MQISYAWSNLPRKQGGAYAKAPGALLAAAVPRSERAAAEGSARLVIVYAISPAAEAFYLRHGFTRLPVEAPTLALDLVKLRRVAGEG
jgi:hypothetical protein